MKALHPVLACLLLATATAACTAEAEGTDPDSESVEVSDLEASRRRLACQLEYARYTPDFKTLPAAVFDEPLRTVRDQGATASDGRFAFQARINPDPPYNLSFVVNIREVATNRNVAYSVLPPPRLGGDYLFELGGRIEPITLPGVVESEQFDFMRSYCSLYLAE